MRKSHKEQLYRAAFRLFILNDFNGVSISDIEKASGMTRGAIFYYADSKMDLFRKVLDTFVVETQNIENKMALKEYGSLGTFIDAYVDGVEYTIMQLQGILGDIPDGTSNRAYIYLVMQISRHFPDLREKYLVYRNNELSKWISVLHKAIEDKEIRAGIDIMSMARTFTNVFYGQSFLDSLTNGLDVVCLRQQMHNLYKVLK
ncbi:TetR/AcrR family transcriptional regulator [Prevotella sp. kh1p2]|uniref:TetR/AcrR family transcriptional regulator n=1 Tax=Prevotella sp. kh1p2 TaxID=1761883 RepID=UPI0008D0A2CA|nr:TetR/AcrR family transcriptional regulator [Prevotella sp. kh1p2]SES78988.1 transcriptional regulator, TetR family [Prevotella sp. kh1p2]SNU10641.1 transcriptional regulator, TetR family [Prevotellaceae bacterium KH2P17]